MLWKVDGNSAGKPTPIKIQRVRPDGVTLLGAPTTLITNDPVDGGLVEAPSMIYWDGCECYRVSVQLGARSEAEMCADMGGGACTGYYLFFSSNSYNSLKYDISYAVSRSATGPFNKVHGPNAPFLVS